MVGGCISASGDVDLVNIYSKMGTEKNHQFLICHAIPSGKRLIVSDFLFSMAMISNTLPV